MANFKEFIGCFTKDYTEEEKQLYKNMYSEESDWPGAGEYEEEPVCIDLDKVGAFNPHTDKDKTTIDIQGCSRLAIKMDYRDFTAIMKTFYSFV